MTTTFKNHYLAATLTVQPDGKRVHIQGKIYEPAAFRGYRLLAARPIDQRTSYAGSGLPFPCPEIAFDQTPNIRDFTLSYGQRAAQPPVAAPEGVLGGHDGDVFDVMFAYPNGYNTCDARGKVPPSVFVIMFPNDPDAEPVYVRLELPDPFPLRTLVHRPGYARGPAYYADKENVFQVLPSSAEQAMFLYGKMKEELDLA